MYRNSMTNSSQHLKIIQTDKLVNFTRVVSRRIEIAYNFQDDLHSKFKHIPKFKKKGTWSPPGNQILCKLDIRSLQMKQKLKNLK